MAGIVCPKEKYTRACFTEEGGYCFEGIETFKQGTFRDTDKALLDRLDFRDNVVLDLGCGCGEAMKYALERGSKKVIGVNFAQPAIKIAHDHLKGYPNVELYCEDTLRFLQSSLYELDLADIVLMLDLIEHIPRAEVKELLQWLRCFVYPCAVIAINTPIFRHDNDVLVEGLKEQDSSDNCLQEVGVHCNRYTEKSLRQFMVDSGYKALSSQLFVDAKSIAPYPLQPDALTKPVVLDYAYQNEDLVSAKPR